MPLPEFTDEEQYLISFWKSESATTQTNTQMWGYLLCAAAVAVFGFYYKDPVMSLLAFVLVFGFRVHEEYSQKKWAKPLRSIILKYEAAFSPNSAS